MFVDRDGDGYAIYAGPNETADILRAYRNALDDLIYLADEDNDPDDAEEKRQQRDAVAEALEIVHGGNIARGLNL